MMTTLTGIADIRVGATPDAPTDVAGIEVSGATVCSRN
jgi:hypothetical protein